jgi:hypothetical protein
MWTLIHEGGWPIWFTLLFGLISLAAAARFARSGDKKHLGFVIGMSAATLFSVANGIVADLSAVGHHLNERWDQYFPSGATMPDLTRLLGQGFAESMSPGILGFTLLSLTWLVAAAGLARSARTPA